MKVLYAIQATGNGHISCAIELMPFLEKYGEVHTFLSGNNSSLQVPFNVQYKSKGVSLFYGNTGGLDYFKMLRAFNPIKIVKDAQQLPVEKYDVVINDFESITTLACKLKNISCVHFGHQASFVSANTPRPTKKDFIGEWILKNYAHGKANIGLHFEQYDDFIFSPILKTSILQATPQNKGHITVYLSHYSDAVVAKSLSAIKNKTFQVFSKQVQQITWQGNICFMPVNNELFTQSLINCEGIITGAGFETPAEALYLGKKLLCMPIHGQYEQLCNAAAIEKFNVPIIHNIQAHFAEKIQHWLNAPNPRTLQLQQSTMQIVQKVIEKGVSLKQNKQEPLLNDLLNYEDFFPTPATFF